MNYKVIVGLISIIFLLNPAPFSPVALNEELKQKQMLSLNSADVLFEQLGSKVLEDAYAQLQEHQRFRDFSDYVKIIPKSETEHEEETKIPDSDTVIGPPTITETFKLPKSGNAFPGSANSTAFLVQDLMDTGMAPVTEGFHKQLDSLDDDKKPRVAVQISDVSSSVVNGIEINRVQITTSVYYEEASQIPNGKWPDLTFTLEDEVDLQNKCDELNGTIQQIENKTRCNVSEHYKQVVEETYAERSRGDPYFKDENGIGLYEYGYEPRTVTITEDFQIEVDKPQEGFEASLGNTFSDEEIIELVTKTRQSELTASSHTLGKDPIKKHIIFGDTLTRVFRDKIEFRLFIPLFFFDLEIFFVRINWEFRYGVGLRLPVEITIEPDHEEQRAEGTVGFKASIIPLNFDIHNYTAYCIDNRLADLSKYQSDICNPDVFSFPSQFNDPGINLFGIPLNGLPIPIVKQGGIVEIKQFDLLNKDDGNELVVRASIVLGGALRIFGIPLFDNPRIIDITLDLATLCTLLFVSKKNFDEFKTQKKRHSEGKEVFTSGFIFSYSQIRDKNMDCGSFTTPYGQECEEIEIAGIGTGTFQCTQRTFPNLGSLNPFFTLPWDCTDATIIGGYPICTQLGSPGLGGLDLSVDVFFGSKTIRGTASPQGDSSGDKIFSVIAGGSGIISPPILFEEPVNEKIVTGLLVDNFEDGPNDFANIKLKNFELFLDSLEIVFKGELAWDDAINDLGIENIEFQIAKINPIPSGFGIKINQHPGTDPIGFDVFVENNALSIAPGSPITTEVGFGESGELTIIVKNEGSVVDDFDNLRPTFSNQVNTKDIFIFPNNDDDCENVAGTTHFFGNSTDGIEDECFFADNTPKGAGDDRVQISDEDPDQEGTSDCLVDGNGNPTTDANGTPSPRDDDCDGKIDEDPVDVWEGFVNPTELNRINSRKTTTTSLTVFPYSHFSTAPGTYPVLVEGDSVGADAPPSATTLAEIDPSQKFRRNSPGIQEYTVPKSYDPRVYINRDITTGEPLNVINYNLVVQNFANAPDNIERIDKFPDSNVGNCDLFERGNIAKECEWRAEPTSMQPFDKLSTLTVGVLDANLNFINNTLPITITPPDGETIIPSDIDIVTSDGRIFEIEAASCNVSEGPFSNTLDITNATIIFNPRGGCFGVSSITLDIALPAWINVTKIALETGELIPGEVKTDRFFLNVTRSWAGMQDSLYEYTANVTSMEDPETPKKSREKTLEHTIFETEESNVRYIGLEISALRAKLNADATLVLNDTIKNNVQTNYDKAFTNVIKINRNQAFDDLEQTLDALQIFQDELTSSDVHQEWDSNAQSIIDDINSTQMLIVENEQAKYLDIGERIDTLTEKIQNATNDGINTGNLVDEMNQVQVIFGKAKINVDKGNLGAATNQLVVTQDELRDFVGKLEKFDRKVNDLGQLTVEWTKDALVIDVLISSSTVTARGPPTPVMPLDCSLRGEFVDLHTCDLRGQDLSNQNFTGANFEDAQLLNADFTSSILFLAKLGGADIRSVDFTNANLTNQDLTDFDLSGSNFTGTDLDGVTLVGAILSGADLSNRDLTGFDLTGVILSGAILRAAILAGIDLSGNDLSGTVLLESDLRNANLTALDLSGVDLTDALITGTDFNGTNLNNSVLKGTDLKNSILGCTDNNDPSTCTSFIGADLSDQDLSEIDFAGANLSGVNFAGTNLTLAKLNNTDLTDAVLFNATLVDANLDGADLTRSDFTLANLSGQDLTGKEISGIVLTGANLTNAILTNLNLSGKDLSAAIFVGSNLAGTFLNDTNLNNANLFTVDLSSKNLTSTTFAGANLTNTIITDADFSKADLSGQDLSGKVLGTATLTDADLSFANLFGQDLTGNSPQGADLSNANLTNAVLNGLNLNGMNLNGATLFGAKLIGTDLTLADLTRANFTNADLTGTIFKEATLSFVVLSNQDLSSKDFTDTDLSNANLNGADLTNADLTRADLTSAIISCVDPADPRNCADLVGATLTDAILESANVRGANLTGIDLSVADLTRADIRGEELTCTDPTDPETCLNLQCTDTSFPIDLTTCKTNISNVDITCSNPLASDLSTCIDIVGANLTGVTLIESSMEFAKLQNQNLTGANLAGKDLINSNLRSADLSCIDPDNTETCTDLIEANLTNADLRNANLQGANLTNADLEGAKLSNANLIDANLTNADLKGADLTGADLTGADLDGVMSDCTFLQANAILIGCDLSNQDLEGFDLSGAVLINADLRNAKLNGTDFTASNLQGADFTMATFGCKTAVPILDEQTCTKFGDSNLNGANLSETDLSDIKFFNVSFKGVLGLSKVKVTCTDLLPATALINCDLSMVDLSNTDLRGAILIDALLNTTLAIKADLEEADLTRANLTLAKLNNADLTGAFIFNATLIDTDLTGANLTRADLTISNLTDAILFGATLIDADLTRANLTRANFTSADLTRADISKANLTDATLFGATLIHADLFLANLTRANLTDANLSDAVLTNATLTNTDFTRANLEDATLDNVIFDCNDTQPGAFLIGCPDLDGERLDNIDLSGAILIGVMLNHTKLNATDLTDADLTRANLTSANVTKADFTRTKLVDTILNLTTTVFDCNNTEHGAFLIGCPLNSTSLVGIDLSGAKLIDANLTDTNLTGADLTDADLTRANLNRTIITDADFTRAILKNQNLTGKALGTAIFTDTDLSNVILTDQNLSNKDLTGTILSGAALTRANLDNADLIDADLSNADLTNAILSNANFSNANLENAILVGADLTNADLRGADLTGADLTGADLDGVMFVCTDIQAGAFLIGCQLDKMELDGLDLSGAVLINVNLTLSLLNFTDLRDADMTRADLTRANLTGADLTDAILINANLYRANLTSANLLGANLTNANLTLADLTDALLFGTDLTLANLTNATLNGAELTNAIVPKANLINATLIGADLIDAFLFGANFTNANLTDADLTRADLTKANFTNADLDGADLTGADLDDTDFTGCTGTTLPPPSKCT